MSPLPPPHPRVGRPLCAERHGLHGVAGKAEGWRWRLLGPAGLALLPTASIFLESRVTWEFT